MLLETGCVLISISKNFRGHRVNINAIYIILYSLRLPIENIIASHSVSIHTSALVGPEQTPDSTFRKYLCASSIPCIVQRW